MKGLVFDWNRIYGEEKPLKISLPTYPFAREKVWVENERRKVGKGAEIQ